MAANIVTASAGTDCRCLSSHFHQSIIPYPPPPPPPPHNQDGPASVRLFLVPPPPLRPLLRSIDDTFFLASSHLHTQESSPRLTPSGSAARQEFWGLHRAYQRLLCSFFWPVQLSCLPAASQLATTLFHPTPLPVSRHEPPAPTALCPCYHLDGG